MKPMLAAASRRSLVELRQRRLVERLELLMARNAEMLKSLLDELSS
jgi:hypothetical protein